MCLPYEREIIFLNIYRAAVLMSGKLARYDAVEETRAEFSRFEAFLIPGYDAKKRTQSKSNNVMWLKPCLCVQPAY
ncbi:MAG: hypothetical protein DRR08_03805 [Candidatus Parabeggiatoa sp. nov. 2]|nr:MAG: hypothetical protein B6247_08445 [Beggiatoa sp. 4572_84]RKZ63327.1 MAG: hypothetical protein DRR08_03805 [Gammaproteobacteria bacterium]